VEEVAARLGVTAQHISDLISEGKLQAVNVGGGSKKFWRIPIEAFEAFIRQRHSLESDFPTANTMTKPK